MRAALYIRVSTEEQAIHGLSIAAQTEALDEWAAAEHVTIVDHYIDAGISARKPASRRPELQRLLNDVRGGSIDIIVFTKLDRWFRNIAEYYKVQEVLDKYQVKWRTIHEDYETETSGGQFKVNIMLSVAQNEADRTGERIKVIFDSKRAKGEACSGSVPPGIRIENKHYVADEPMAEAMRDVFQHYITVRSLYNTKNYLASKYGLYRDSKTFKRLMRNKKYRGLVVDEETFDLAQEIIAQRAQRHSVRTAGNVFLFSGLVHCPECGRKMSAHVCKGHTYYRCITHYSKGTCSYSWYIREDKIEAYLLSNVLAKCIEYNANAKAQAKPTVDEAAIRHKMSKLKDLYLSDLIDRDEYERDFRELRSILEQPRPKQKMIDIARVRSTLQDYNELTQAGKKEFWTRTLAEIRSIDKENFNLTLRQL